MFRRKTMLSFAVLVGLLLSAAGCGAATPEVIEKEVVVEKPVIQTVVVTEEKVVKETVVETVVVEKEVAKVVEKVVTATPEPTPTAPTGPVKGGTVTIVRDQEPDKLADQWTPLTVSSEVINMVNDSLVVYNDQGELVPFLAVEVPTFENGGISPDGKSITWRLREDVTWHDGTPFTAKDVQFTIETAQGPDNAAVTLLRDFESVETPDDHTVIVNFSVASSALAERFDGYALLPEHALRDVEDWTAAEYFGKPYPGTGPFMFVEWVRGSHILVERNPDYYLGEPFLDKVVYRIMPNDDARLTTLATGEADVTLYAIGEHVPLYRGVNGVTVYETPAYSGFFFELNLTDPILADVRTRRALNYAFDREGVVQTIVKGLGSPKWSPIHPPSWAWTDVEHKYPYDPEKAKALLEEVGWKDADGDGIREAHGVEGIPDGTNLAWTITNIAGQAERLQICQVAQQQFREIGADVDINTMEVSTWVEKNNTGDFTMAYGYRGGSPDPSSIVWWWRIEDAMNWRRIETVLPDIDNLLNKAEASLDIDERMGLYAEFQNLVTEWATDLFVYNRNFYDVANAKLQNFKPTPSGIATWNTHEWWLKP